MIVQPVAKAVSPLMDADTEALADADLVSVRNVSKSFGSKRVLDRVSFSVPGGQICGLLGPNGAGKTTLFRLLMGILKPTEGSLSIAGLDAFDDRVATKRLVGFLPDEPDFYSYLSAQETLELSAAMHGLDVKTTLGSLEPLLERLHLTDELQSYAEDFSRGMKKKLGLLLAMMHRPKLLILDEPTNGLDVESTHVFYDLVTEASAEGTTVLFSTHLMDHVEKLCTHVVIINDGRQVASASLAELVSTAGAGVSLEDVFLTLTRRPVEE